jgi:hypothetical protein
LNPRLPSLMVRKWSTGPISLSYTTPSHRCCPQRLAHTHSSFPYACESHAARRARVQSGTCFSKASARRCRLLTSAANGKEADVGCGDNCGGGRASSTPRAQSSMQLLPRAKQTIEWQTPDYRARDVGGYDHTPDGRWHRRSSAWCSCRHHCWLLTVGGTEATLCGSWAAKSAKQTNRTLHSGVAITCHPPTACLCTVHKMRASRVCVGGRTEPGELERHGCAIAAWISLSRAAPFSSSSSSSSLELPSG